jgi:hypothetical protein
VYILANPYLMGFPTIFGAGGSKGHPPFYGLLKICISIKVDGILTQFVVKWTTWRCNNSFWAVAPLMASAPSPAGLECMRVYFTVGWFIFFDEACWGALFNAWSFRDFCRNDVGRARAVIRHSLKCFLSFK